MNESIKVGDRSMVPVGLGLWKIDRSETAYIVAKAIEIGYRHLDSAADYGNEAEVGTGIAEAISRGHCNREQLWITSKLWNTYHAKDHVRSACERSLIDLGLDYLDLYLIHFPISLEFVSFQDRYPPGWYSGEDGTEESGMKIDPVPLSETWLAMEQLVESGLVRGIGICNYNTGLLNDLMAYARIKPVMLQIEAHPYLTQDNLIRQAKDYNIAVTAFSPLGSLSYVSLDMATEHDSILQRPEVLEISNEVDRTPAQVVLKWGIQRGTAIVPKTVQLKRLEENIALFDFQLTDKHMESITSLNCNRRFNDPAVFCEDAFGKFYSIYD
tara:strand:- start:2893 stop:3873 length:981 start_codon:yes stop_codon:yes gene_type:complete